MFALYCFDRLHALIAEEGVGAGKQALQSRDSSHGVASHVAEVHGDDVAHAAGFVGHGVGQGRYRGFTNLSQNPQSACCNSEELLVGEGATELWECGACFRAKEYERLAGVSPAVPVRVIDDVRVQHTKFLESARQSLQEMPSKSAVVAGPVGKEESGVCSHVMERIANGFLRGQRYRLVELLNPRAEEFAFVGWLRWVGFMCEDGDQDEPCGGAEEKRLPFSHGDTVQRKGDLGRAK